MSSFKQHVKIGQRCWRLVLEPVKAKLCNNHSNHHQFYPWYLIRKFRPFGWWVMKKNANNSKLYTLSTAFFELPWIALSFEPAPIVILREAFPHQNGWISKWPWTPHPPISFFACDIIWAVEITPTRCREVKGGKRITPPSHVSPASSSWSAHQSPCRTPIVGQLVSSST